MTLGLLIALCSQAHVAGAVPTAAELAESWKATNPPQAYKWEANWQVHDKENSWTFKTTSWVLSNEEWKIQFHHDAGSTLLFEWVLQAQGFFYNGQRLNTHMAKPAFFPLRWWWQLPFSLLNAGTSVSLSKQQGAVSYQVQWPSGNILWLKTDPLVPIRMRLTTGCEWRWSITTQKVGQLLVAKTWTSQWEAGQATGQTTLVVPLRPAANLNTLLSPSSASLFTTSPPSNAGSQDPVRDSQHRWLSAWAKACWGAP
ncbi:MAG: hypothetical protein N2Z70_02540 [Bdellovibrionaceae bacterium]|nr:hypothetical protein [Pseudobdellovibrionaceae bacterium]